MLIKGPIKYTNLLKSYISPSPHTQVTTIDPSEGYYVCIRIQHFHPSDPLCLPAWW